MSLHTYKVQNHNASTSKAWHFDTYPNPNSPCAHLFILIIFDSISHIYAVHTQRKFYQSCRWGVALPPRRTSVRKQVGRRRRGALVVACRWGAAVAAH